MAFPPAFLDELRARVGLAALIGRRVKLTRKGREFSGLCPFHNEKTPSFTVNEEKGFFHCFGCGAHGDAIGFVMRSEGSSFVEAVEKLAGEAGLPVPQASPEDRQRADRHKTLLGAIDAAARFFEAELKGPRGKTARDYLLGRGLSEATIARFRLGYAPDSRSALREALTKEGFPEALLIEAGLLKKPEDGGAAYDRFRGRVIFPIADRRGRPIAFGGRIMVNDPDKPKYLNSPESPLFHKGRELFGLAQAHEAIRTAREVVVVEGYMDVIALSQAGIGQAVAPLGTALTEEQILLLWRLTDEPILCFDGDNAGQRAAARAAERALPLLQPGRSLRFALLPPGDDPDSLVRAQGAEAFGAIKSRAEPLVDLIWRLEWNAGALDTPERRAGFRQRLRQRIGQIGDGTVQEDYRAEIDRRLAEAFGYRREGMGGGAGNRPAGPGAGRPGFRSGPGGGSGGSGSGARAWGRPTPPFSPGGAALKAGISDGYRRQQETLLAIVLNHPEIALRQAEILAHLSLPDRLLDKLRQAIIDLAAAWPDLDAEAARRHLSEQGFSGLLEALTTRTKDQKFCQPDASPTDAEAAFDHLLALLRERQLGEEHKAAIAALAENPTPEALARSDALRQALEEGESRRKDIDGKGPK